MCKKKKCFLYTFATHLYMVMSNKKKNTEWQRYETFFVVFEHLRCFFQNVEWQVFLHNLGFSQFKWKHG